MVDSNAQPISQVIRDKKAVWICYACLHCRRLNLTVVRGGKTYCDDCMAVFTVDFSVNPPTIADFS